MVDIEELKDYLSDINVPLDQRIKALVISQERNFGVKAYLGKVLESTITKEDQTRFSQQISRLKDAISSWQTRANFRN